MPPQLVGADLCPRSSLERIFAHTLAERIGKLRADTTFLRRHRLKLPLQAKYVSALERFLAHQFPHHLPDWEAATRYSTSSSSARALACARTGFQKENTSVGRGA